MVISKDRNYVSKRRYRLKNKLKYNEYQKKYYKNNKNKIKEYQQNYYINFYKKYNEIIKLKKRIVYKKKTEESNNLTEPILVPFWFVK